MNRIISVDCGKDDTKILMRNSDGTCVKNKISTRLTDATELTSVNRQMDKSIDVVEYEGQKFAVGDPSGSTSNSNSKKDMVHKILTLTAIAKMVDTGDSVSVAIGCPLSVYLDKEEREDYLNYILPQGKVSITINGKPKNFYIATRICLSESVSALFMFPEMFKKEIVGVIDIGGLNINCSYFAEGKLIANSCFTDKFGKLHVMRKIMSELNQKLDAQFEEFEVEHFLTQGYVTNAEEQTRPIIARAFDDNLNDIEKACARNGWNVRYCKLLFIGGTAKLLEEQIKAKYPNAVIPEDSDYVNAEGYMRALCMQMKVGV